MVYGLGLIFEDYGSKFQSFAFRACSATNANIPGVAVGKSVLSSVFVSSVKGDSLCDFECGPQDVARAQVGGALCDCKGFGVLFHEHGLLKMCIRACVMRSFRLCGSGCSSAAAPAA